MKLKLKKSNHFLSEINHFKNFNWKVFFALCAVGLAPAVYTTIRTYLIAENTAGEGVDVLGQTEWFDLIDETLKSFLITPLYAVFVKLFRKKIFPNIVFKGLISVFIIYSTFSLGIYFWAHSLIKFMNSETIDIALVEGYLRLETVAFVVYIVLSFVNVINIVINKSSNIYFLLITQVILMVIGDFVLIPRFGVNGVAYSNIISASFLSVIGLFLLWKKNFLRFCWFHKSDLKIAKEWFKTGFFSGLQVFIDNIIYALMIIKLVNSVSEQGNYWAANNFIWTWLLVPISALSEVIRRDAAEDYFNLKLSNYYFLILLISFLWVVTIPGWAWFYQVPEHLENYTIIFEITIKLFGFYLFYSLAVVPDSIFAGRGKTKYSALNSALINFVYYGVWFLCYLVTNMTITMDLIIVMFGCGLFFHLLISQIELDFFLKKEMFSKELTRNLDLNKTSQILLFK